MQLKLSELGKIPYFQPHLFVIVCMICDSKFENKLSIIHGEKYSGRTSTFQMKNLKRFINQEQYMKNYYVN